MNRYIVEYELNEVRYRQRIKASNPGEAFAECLKLNPGAKLLKCGIYGKFGTAEGQQEWDAPVVQRDLAPDPKPPRPLKPENRDCILPFYDDVKGKKTT